MNKILVGSLIFESYHHVDNVGNIIASTVKKTFSHKLELVKATENEVVFQAKLTEHFNAKLLFEPNALRKTLFAKMTVSSSTKIIAHPEVRVKLGLWDQPSIIHATITAVRELRKRLK